MSKTAILRICGYVIGFGSLLSAQVVSAIIAPYGASQNTTTHILAIVGSVVTLATLVKGVVDTATPAGYTQVIAPKAAVPMTEAQATSPPPVAVTTVEAVKAGVTS